MARRRRAHPLTIFYAIVIGGLLIGSSLWLDRRGELVVAPVSTKSEQITVTHDPQASWYHWYQVGVGVGGAGETPWVATVRVPRDRYDSLRVGDSIAVRYLRAMPLLARTADRSTATVAWEILNGLASPLILWVVGGVAALCIAARLGTIPILASGLGWMVAGFLLLLRAPSPPIPTGPERTARVSAVTLVTKSPARRSTRRRRSRAFRSDAVRRLAVPYQVVQLHVPVLGRTDSVLAVDAVDSGSVPGLVAGAVLPAHFEPHAPRAARLTAGTRSFVEGNRYHFLTGVLGIPVIGVLGALGFSRRRARRTENTIREVIMPQRVRTAIVLFSALLSSGALSKVSAQSTGGAGRRSENPACALLTVDEVRKATGRQDYTNASAGDAPGEGIGGGSSCQYGAGWAADGPPEFGLVLIPLNGKPSRTESDLRAKPRSGCERERLSGVGDVAYLQLCSTNTGLEAYVKSGANDLIVIMRTRPPATPASVKPLVVAIARAAAAKLR